MKLEPDGIPPRKKYQRSVPRDFFNSIRGTTVTDHKLRVMLDLTMEEYTLLDFIYMFNRTYKEKKPSFGDIWTFSGMTKEIIQEVYNSLKAKGFIHKPEGSDRVDTAPAWNRHFDTDAQFEELWQIHRKGNKAGAKMRFMKCIKLIPFSDLAKALKEYRDSKDDPIYLKDLETWLNPLKKHWEDPIVGKDDKDMVNTNTPDNFFKRN